MKIIPLPNQYHLKYDVLIINQNTKFNYAAEFVQSVKDFKDFVFKTINIELKQAEFAEINFVLDFSLELEEYHFEITENQLTLCARTDQGAFYGIQSLKQLFVIQDNQLEIRCGWIKDAPRFSYRGFMLDVARHFFKKEVIFRLIDLISFHKFNTLHLHLTDDQGWRVEIKKYPLLTEIGSIRQGTIQKDKTLDHRIHQGFYSKEDLKEIVAYAKSKFVEVIPEIDLPGHMNAMIAAYPNLSCRGKEIEVRTSFGINKTILCGGNPQVYQMIEDILLEIIEIFDSKYIHLGGDEAPTTYWKKCPKCQKMIKDNNLRNERQLQTYLFNHFANFLKHHGKIVIGWNEVINHQLSNNVIIQHWKPFTKKKTIQAINKGRKTIISNFFYLYLDYPYSMTPLQKIYNFNPIFKGVNQVNNIIGIEAPLWTEWVDNPAKIDFQVFPRLAAVAEMAWTNRNFHDYDDFLVRLKSLNKYYQDNNVFYCHDFSKKPILKRIKGTYQWIKCENIEFNQNTRHYPK